MKAEDLYMAIGETDGKYIKEAENIKSKPVKSVLAIAVAAAVIIMCGCTAFALGGHFKDIKNIFGTVTGTEYLDATEEIDIDFIGFSGGVPEVEIILKTPDKAPYNTLGAEITLGEYEILDESGAAIKSDELAPGRYTLKVRSLIMTSKGDQPMEIKGDWSAQLDLSASR